MEISKDSFIEKLGKFISDYKNNPVSKEETSEKLNTFLNNNNISDESIAAYKISLNGDVKPKTRKEFVEEVTKYIEAHKKSKEQIEREQKENPEKKEKQEQKEKQEGKQSENQEPDKSKIKNFIVFPSSNYKGWPETEAKEAIKKDIISAASMQGVEITDLYKSINELNFKDGPFKSKNFNLKEGRTLISVMSDLIYAQANNLNLDYALMGNNGDDKSKNSQQSQQNSGNEIKQPNEQSTQTNNEPQKPNDEQQFNQQNETQQPNNEQFNHQANQANNLNHQEQSNIQQNNEQLSQNNQQPKSTELSSQNNFSQGDYLLSKEDIDSLKKIGIKNCYRLEDLSEIYPEIVDNIGLQTCKSPKEFLDLIREMEKSGELNSIEQQQNGLALSINNDNDNNNNFQ